MFLDNDWEIKGKLVDNLASIFNCNIDYGELLFVLNEYLEFKDNPNINVLNYPFVKRLVEKQDKRVNDFKDLVDECLVEGFATKYGVIKMGEDKFFVVELGIKEFEDEELMREYYKHFIY